MSVLKLDIESKRAESPIQPAFAEIDGLRIRYARSHKPDAETIVLTSPWPESLYAFVPVWEKLAAHYDVLAFDLPAFGHSEGREAIATQEGLGEFLVKVIQHFDIDRPHVVGPNVGVALVLFAAANHPDAFASITVANGAVAVPLAICGKPKEIIEAPDQDEVGNGPEIVDTVLSHLKHYVVPAYVRDDYVASYQGARWAGSARYARAYPQGLPALAERLSEIKTPVQVIAAKDDPYIPRSNPDYLAERLPNVQLNVADVEHIMWEENPDVFAKMVMDWAAAHPRS